jgi:hypothetical protein
LILLLFVFFSTTTDLHNQALQLGDHLWPSYYELREDPVPPDCNPEADIESEVERLAEERLDDDIAGLLGESEVDRESIRESVIAAREACESERQAYEQTKDRITPAVRTYRYLEQQLAELTETGLNWQRPMLILLLMICAATATLGRHQIAIRGIETVTDYRVSYTGQLIANILLLGSSWIYRAYTHEAMDSVPPERDALHLLWILCFGVLSLASPLPAVPGARRPQAGWERSPGTVDSAAIQRHVLHFRRLFPELRVRSGDRRLPGRAHGARGYLCQCGALCLGRHDVETDPCRYPGV